MKIIKNVLMTKECCLVQMVVHQGIMWENSGVREKNKISITSESLAINIHICKYMRIKVFQYISYPVPTIVYYILYTVCMYINVTV